MPQQPNATTYTDAAIIAENEKWFNVWLKLPKWLTWTFAIIFFVSGLVMGISTELLSGLLIIWITGAVYCALNYFFLKVVMSYKILHIYYLKKLSSDNNNNASTPSATAASEPDDALPTI